MNNLESVITYIRNNLRVEGITGMDSINHCIAFVVARYLTIDKCNAFDIPVIFAYENFLKNEDGSVCDNQKVIAKFFTEDAEKDCLYVHLQNKLNFTTFKFKIGNPIIFENIYKKLNDININYVFDAIDIVGFIYELHLKTGSSGSGMRDLGQYFTNRNVINYMCKLCDPKLKDNGDIETILDPAMGTGGFLIMSIKYLNKKYSNIDWKKNKNNIFGFDVDDTVKNLAILNALLESGEIFNDTFIKNDTLHNDYKLLINNNKLIDKVDIILANEPFGLKNIVYDKVCERIKSLNIKGCKGEPLFLQLMMQSLKHNGRCAIIIPDGVLFNDTVFYNLTRKYLCDNLRLVKIISLDDGLFLNTGVKSSILFFVNDGITTNVEFCKIKLINNDIVENTIITVNITDIQKNKYSLSVNKYNIIEDIKIEGMEYKTLGDICKFLPKSKRQASYGKTTGTYKFYTSSVKIQYCDIADYNETSIIIGTGGNANVKISNNFSCSTDNFIINSKDNTILLNYYVYYWMNSNISILENCFHGSTIKHLSKSDLQNIIIPIPSLERQTEIVKYLDFIYDQCIKISTAKILDLKLLNEYCLRMQKMLGQNRVTTLGEVCKFLPKSKRQASYGKTTGTYKFYTSSVKLHYCDIADYNETSIIIGTGGNANVKISNNFSCSADNFIINSKDNTILLNYYIYFWLYSNISILENCFHGTTIKHLSKSDLQNIIIPIPSLERQTEIVAYCEFNDMLIQQLKTEITQNKTQANLCISNIVKNVGVIAPDENNILAETPAIPSDTEDTE